MPIQKKDFLDFRIFTLTNQFYSDYPDPPYRELMRKNKRPYNCLLMRSSYGYFICIPYRSHINHKYAYKFKNSARSRNSKSGLDYSKMVIIHNFDYLSTQNAIIDSDEYKETRQNIEHIKNDITKYINEYIDYVRLPDPNQAPKKLKRKYMYSTLQYFHRELNIQFHFYEAIFTF